MMLRLTFLLIISSFLTDAQIIYTSPIDQSWGHNPEATIIIKTKSAIITDLGDAFDLIGANSGVLEYKIIETDAQNTYIIKPKGRFLLGDHIALSAKHDLYCEDATVINDFQLEFDIRKQAMSHSSEEVLDEGGVRVGLPQIIYEVNTSPTNLPIFFRNAGNPGDKYMAILENSGTEIWSEQLNNIGQNFSLTESGYLSMFNNPLDEYYLMDSSYNIFDTVVVGNGYITDMHEFEQFSNGHFLMMAYDDQQVDMSQIVVGGDPNATVTGTIYQELDANKNVIFQWRTWDHFQITDTYNNTLSSNIDYAHGNSLQKDVHGNYLASFRNMNEVTYFSGTTGQIIWRLNGKNNDFTLINDDSLGFTKQHDSRWLTNGNVSVFDNGSEHAVPLASVKEYQIDTNNWTATVVWRFDNPSGAPTGKTGNAQRLDNGNTFINWGSRSDVTHPNWTEVDQSGTIVFQARFAAGSSYSCYRAKRYPWDLTVNVNQIKDLNLKAYPIPAINSLHIEGLEPEMSLSIHGMDGKIYPIDFEGNEIQVSHLASAVYILKIQKGDSVQNLKFIKQ